MINRRECEVSKRKDALADMKKKKALAEWILLVIFIVGLILSTIEISDKADLSEKMLLVLEKLQLGISVITIFAALGIIIIGIYFRIRERHVVSDC